MNQPNVNLDQVHALLLQFVCGILSQPHIEGAQQLRALYDGDADLPRPLVVYPHQVLHSDPRSHGNQPIGEVDLNLGSAVLYDEHPAALAAVLVSDKHDRMHKHG